MNIAIISNHVVSDVALFDDLDTARGFLDQRVWPEADTVVELPEGFGVGDTFDGAEWTKALQPEPDAGQNDPKGEPLEAFISRVVEEKMGALQGIDPELVEAVKILIGGG